MASSRISGITIEIGGDTSSLSKALQSVNNEIKTTQTQLKDVEKLLKFDPTNTELLAQKQKALTTEIADTKTKLETMRTAADQANDALAKGEISQQQYDALQREIIATEQELKNLCNAAAEANTTLQQIGAVGTTLQNVGSSMTSLGKSMTMGVTMPLVAIGSACVATAADFDSAMSEVQAISGATGAEFDQLKNAAMEAGSTTVFSMTDAAEALKYMSLAGWDANQSCDALPGVLNLAAASGMELAEASDMVTDYLSAFGMEASQAAYMADLLSYAQANSNTTTAQLGEAFGNCAATMAASGQDIETTTSLLEAMANQGTKGSEAGTQLKNIMKDLTSNMEDGIVVIGDYGISIADMDGNFRDLSDILFDIEIATSDMTETERAAELQNIFTTKSLQGLNQIFMEGVGTCMGYEEALRGSEGAAQEMADIMNDNLSGQLKELGSKVEALAYSFGELLVPIISNVVGFIQDLVTKFQNLDEGTKEMIVTIGLIAAAIGPVLTILGTLTSTIGTVLVKVSDLGTKLLGLVYQAQAGVGPLAALQTAIAGITAPVAAVIAVVGSLVAAFLTLWNTNEEFRNSIIEIWDAIKETVGNFIQGVIDRINDLGFSFEGISDIVEAVKQVWIDFCNIIAPIFEGAFQAVQTILDTVLNVILGLLDIFIGVFTGNWEQVWQGASSIVETIWNAISSLISTVLDTIFGVISNILGNINETWQSVWDGISSFVSGIWETISSTVSNTLSSILSTVGSVLGNIVSTIQNGLNSAKEFVLGIVNEALQWGADLVGNIAQGITNAIGKVVDAVSGVASKIKSFLHFSVPDEGPLTDLMNWMPDMVQTLADGINEGASIVESACSQLANAAMSALESGFNGSYSLAQNFTSNMNVLWNTWLMEMQQQLSTTSQAITTDFTAMFTQMQASLTAATSSMQSAVTSFVNSIKQTFNQAFNTLQSEFNSFLQSVESSLNQHINTYSQTINQFVQQTTQLIQQTFTELTTLTETSMTTIETAIQTHMTAIVTNVTTSANELLTNYTTAMNGLQPATETGFAPALSYIEGLIPKFKQWGIDMMDNLISGIKAKEDELRRELEKIADMIDDYMGYSVPEKGPMKNADEWMPDMMKLFAEGIRRNKSLVTDQMKSLAGDMALMTGSGSQSKQPINLTIENVTELDGKEIGRTVDKYLGVAYG